MEVLGTRRRARETSPDRAKVVYNMQPKPNTNTKPVIKKVQVVYYLTRNGHLEHPHYMEVTHFSNQPLRLRDVIDRLTVLRGKNMPSLYSWSCKRSYKNGYVWNDLAENDIIHPADNGAEFVLKGSEFLDHEGCSEKFQQLQVSSRVQLIQEPNYNVHSKSSKSLMTPSQPEEFHEQEDQEDDDEQESYEDEEKCTSYTSSTTPHSRCSRGVSTDELDDQEPEGHHSHHHQLSGTKSHINPKTPTESTTTHHSNKSTNSSPSMSSILSRERPNQPNSNNTSRRFEDGDPDSVSRNSVLLQLISCGNLAVSKAKTAPCFKQSGISGDLRKGIVCRSAAVKATEEEEIKFMSENPRFGNLQAEEKEYFSGSIIESMSKDRVEATPPGLKRSNSYNEERSCKAGLEEAKVMDQLEDRRNDGVKGKCIPRKKSVLSSKRKIKK